MKLLQKLLLSIVALILITSVSIGLFSYFLSSSSTNDLMMSKVDDQLTLRSELIQEKINSTKNTIQLIAKDERVLTALYTQSTSDATRLFTAVIEQNQDLISLIAIVDTNDIVTASDEASSSVIGVDLSSRAYLQDAKANSELIISDLIISKESGKSAIAICEPIYYEGQYIGSLIATIDFELFSAVVAETKIATEGYGYLIDITGENAGQIVYHPVAKFVEEETNMKDINGEGILEITERIINEQTGDGRYKYDGDSKYVKFIHIENWALIITANDDDLNATSRSIRNVTFFTILIGIILSTIVSYYLVKRIITGPITELETAMASAGNGDLQVHVRNKSKDEIGNLSRSFMKMIDSLKDVLSTINVASEQVSSGSDQLSDSSMALSSGATEQAASVEELTATVEQISTQTNQNAKNAEEAQEIVEGARSDAETGNQQMTHMLEAMTEINDASSNISKIIKVIDDIAFQTNILALNAAVEAARAGEHGKGFAVVAEEVRNLAAQSADAAKETTVLIEGSIAKVKDGTEIANDTAKSLEKIVAQINETTQLVNEIAKASTEQSYGVNEIHQGINQISAVVQTTSATAQETAAASEELSSQASMLQNKVATFKL